MTSIVFHIHAINTILPFTPIPPSPLHMLAAARWNAARSGAPGRLYGGGEKVGDGADRQRESA